MSSLIVGHTSMLGLALKRQLTEIGEHYVTAGRSDDSDIHIDLSVQPPSLLELPSEIKSIDTIYVLASSFEGDNSNGVNMNMLVNSAGSGYIILLSALLKPKALIYSGTVFSYDYFDVYKGLTSYGLTKKFAEELLGWWSKQNQIRFASIRFSQLFDDMGMCVVHQPWIGRIVRYAFEKCPLYLPASESKRNFLHVQDAAKLLIEASKNTSLSGILNGCSPCHYSYEDLAHMAFSFNNCLDQLIISSNKQKFRPISLPKEKLLYDIINKWPLIDPLIWINNISTLQTWSHFGPMDVNQV